MIPRARAFEKAVRRQARKLLRADKASWKEYRLRRRAPSTHAPPWLFSLILTLFVAPLLVFRLRDDPNGGALIALVVALYGTGSGFTRAAALLHDIRFSHDLLVFAHLPMSDAEFLRMRLMRAFRSSLWVLSAFLLAYIGLGAAAGVGAPGHLRTHMVLFAALLALVQWATVVALAAVVAGYRPGWWSGWIGFGLNCAAFLGAAFPPLLKNVTQLPWQAVLVLPGGWPAAAFQRGLLLQERDMLWLAAPPLLLLLFVPGALRRLRQFYVLRELSVSAQGRTTTIMAVDPRTLQPADPRDAARHYDFVRAHSGAVPAEDLWAAEKEVLSGRFLGPLDWRKLPVLERMIAACLTVRERTVLEFLCRDWPGWTAAWRNLTLIMALVLVALHAAPALAFWVALFGGLYGLSSGSLTPTGAAFPGLRSLPCSGKFIPLHALYPLSFGGLSRVLLSVAMFRTLALLPCAVLCGAATAWIMHRPPAQGAELATKAVALLLAAQPGLVAFLLFRGTSYAEQITLRSIPWQVSLLAWGASLIVAGLVMVMYSGMPAALAAIAAALLTGLFWLWSRYLYENGRADLVRTTSG
ncbi:MAG: hypothetical protein NTW87_06210 [Planctomycetota bacterium]|nr:hypothetical protein [Planctomycetota bacterium]